MDTKPLVWVIEGADPTKKPHLLTPRTEFQYREQATVFVKSGPHPPICERALPCPDPFFQDAFRRFKSA